MKSLFLKVLSTFFAVFNLLISTLGISTTKPLGSFYQFFEDDEAWVDAQYLDPENYRPGEYEWWYADGHLDNGFVFTASFHMQIQANGEMVTLINLNLTQNGEIIRVDKIMVDPETASFSKEKCDVRMGKSYFRSLDGLRTFEIYIDDEQGKGVGLHLTLNKTVTSFTARPKFMQSDKDYFDWMCTVPNGNISGTITVGDTTTEVQGTGYHDHNWGDTPLTGLVDNWLWSRGEVDGFTTVASSIRYKNGTTLNLVFIATEEKVYVATVGPGVYVKELRNEVNPESGNMQTLDCEYSFITLSGIGTVTFKSEELLASFAHIGNSGNQLGWYTRYRASTSIKMESLGISTGEGFSMYEIMDLNLE